MTSTNSLADLDVALLLDFSGEQLEFLDKFFKENPWADSAQFESIVKATGLTEAIVKVREPRMMLRTRE